MRQTLVAAAFAILTLGSAASAATINFDGTKPGDKFNYEEAGLIFDVTRIVNGNCDSASGKPCMALNNNEQSILTKIGGGLFSLSSFWFQLLGNGTGNTLLVETDKGSLSLPVGTWGKNNGGNVIDLTSNTDFFDVAYVKFFTTNGGNVRVDDLTTPSAVPVPAAGLLLAGGLGLMAAVRRRRA